MKESLAEGLFEEPENEAFITIAVAEGYAYKHDYLQLELVLPSLIEIAFRLVEQSGQKTNLVDYTIKTDDSSSKHAILLNRLIAAIHDFLIVSLRRDQLIWLTENVYIISYNSNYKGKWEDLGNRAYEMVRLNYLLVAEPEYKISKMKQWFELAINANERSKEKKGNLDLHFNALVSSLENRIEDAKKYFIELVKYYEVRNNYYYTVQTLLELGKLVEEKDDDCVKAIIYFEQALQIIKQTGLEFFKCDCFFHLGCIFYSCLEYDLASERFLASLDIAIKFGIRHIQGKLYRMLAKTFNEKGNFSIAYDYANQALIVESYLKSPYLITTKQLLAEIEENRSKSNMD